MHNIFLLSNFLIGTCLASHAAMMFEHWENFDFLFTRSHCQNCYSELSLLDELPLISFICLKGKCHYCQAAIPPDLFFFELVGGFLFLNINFASSAGILTTLLFFSLLLVAIADYHQHQFDLKMLSPALIITSLFNNFNKYTSWDWLILIIMTLVFTCYIFKAKLGSGDFLIYLILSSFYSPTAANQIFLLASLGLICLHLINHGHSSDHYPFIPFILWGLIIFNLK